MFCCNFFDGLTSQKLEVICLPFLFMLWSSKCFQKIFLQGNKFIYAFQAFVNCELNN